VKKFFNTEKSLIGSFVMPGKKSVSRAKHGKVRATRRHKAVPA
jgi:hypothetical protein